MQAHTSQGSENIAGFFKQICSSTIYMYICVCVSNMFTSSCWQCEYTKIVYFI